MISDVSAYRSFSYSKKLCYIAADYEAELRKDTQASCEVDGEGWFTLSEERFKTAEILFQPHMGGMYVVFGYGLIAFITVQLWLLNIDLYRAGKLWACIKQYLYVWITAIILKWLVMTAGTRRLF